MSLPQKARGTAGRGRATTTPPEDNCSRRGGRRSTSAPGTAAGRAQPLSAPRRHAPAPRRLSGVCAPISHFCPHAASQLRAASPAPSLSKHPGRVSFPPSEPPRRGTLSQGWMGFPARIPPGETHLHPPEPCPNSLLPPLPLPWQPEPRRANRKQGPRSSGGSRRRCRRPGARQAGREGRACRAGLNQHAGLPGVSPGTWPPARDERLHYEPFPAAASQPS